MAKSNDIESQIFDQGNLPPREQVTDWVKIKEKLGTRVAGTYLGFWEKPAEGVYRRMVTVALRSLKDESIVYGVTLPECFEKDLSTWLVGDKVGFEYYKDIPAKEAGVSPTKAIRSFNLDAKSRGGSSVSPSVKTEVQNVGKESASTTEDVEEDPFA